MGSHTESVVVSESAFFSDESSFYGDEKTKSEYDTRTRRFDPDEFWTVQQRSLQWIADQNRAAAEAKAARSRYHHKQIEVVDDRQDGPDRMSSNQASSH